MFDTKMDVRNVFGQFDTLLLLTGLKENVTTRRVKYINLLLRVALLVSLYYVCVLNFLIITDKFDLLFFVSVLLPIGTIIKHHCLWYKLDTYRKFTYELCNAVTTYTNNSNKYNKHFAFSLMPAILGSAMSQMIYFALMRDELKQRRQVVSSATTSDNVIVHWLNTIVMYYAYSFSNFVFFWFAMCYVSSLSNVSYLHAEFLLVSTQVLQLRNANSVLTLRNKLRQLYTLFNELFDLFPVIWCTIMYSLMAGLIVMWVRVQAGASSTAFVMDAASLLSADICFTITILVASTIVYNMHTRKMRALDNLKDIAHFNHDNKRIEDVHYAISCVEGLDLKLSGDYSWSIVTYIIVTSFA